MRYLNNLQTKVESNEGQAGRSDTEISSDFLKNYKWILRSIKVRKVDETLLFCFWVMVLKSSRMVFAFSSFMLTSAKILISYINLVNCKFSENVRIIRILNYSLRDFDSINHTFFLSLHYFKISIYNVYQKCRWKAYKQYHSLKDCNKIFQMY